MNARVLLMLISSQLYVVQVCASDPSVYTVGFVPSVPSKSLLRRGALVIDRQYLNGASTHLILGSNRSKKRILFNNLYLRVLDI